MVCVLFFRGGGGVGGACDEVQTDNIIVSLFRGNFHMPESSAVMPKCEDTSYGI